LTISSDEAERLRGLLTHFRNRLLAYAPLADDMIAEMDAALSYDPLAVPMSNEGEHQP
jgi:hypothetical protein